MEALMEKLLYGVKTANDNIFVLNDKIEQILQRLEELEKRDE